MRSSDQWERAMREANISTDGLSRVIGKGEIRMDNDELLTGREAEEQQTADLVEVVRCSKCRHHRTHCWLEYCDHWHMWLPSGAEATDFFCKDGEEKIRFTQDEVERAKAIKMLWPDAKTLERRTSLEIFIVEVPAVLNWDRFPSLGQGETTDLYKIIRGYE